MRTLVAIGVFAVIGSGLIGACGSSGGSAFVDPNAGDSGDGTSSGDPGRLDNGDGSLNAEAGSLNLAPADPVVTFTVGGPAPTVQFTATNVGGATVPAVFSIDRGEIGGIDANTGLFTATGSVGGKATITASWSGHTATTSVTVKIRASDNGLAWIPTGGAGGADGVGGEGTGGPVDAATVAILKGTTTADANLELLYPYNKTVWPRGVLAPLMQWQLGAQTDYDAIYIKLEEGAYAYEGTFAKTGTTFIHHPIPAAAWKTLLASNAGEDVTVTIVLSKGTTAYGPLTETWKIASAPLKGIVYYNSYGTTLAKNYAGAVGGDHLFGAATLSIKPGATGPALVAGGPPAGMAATTDGSQCRVCHSVAGNGSMLITQRSGGDQKKFSAYDLKTGTETQLGPDGSGFAWPAIYPDGSLFLGDSSSGAGSSAAQNGLYASGSAAPTAITTNWETGFRAAYPSFSPDGKNLAFTLFAGVAGADTKTLGTRTFDKATSTFGPINAVHVPTAGTDLFPSYLPTNSAIVFEHETVYNGRDYGGTRSQADVAPPDVRADQGTHAELWWVDLKTNNAVALDNLNGKNAGVSYLPTGPNAHTDDTTLNYEPTVNPVPSGGYAWVVFTSRRLYGNIATMNPYYSDPRYHDLTSQPTPKKLWVAAIDLNAPAGTDPSHPAFYLPAQEILAGNSRGYWVVDPCENDGSSCETGDECCGGFCRPAGDGGALVCSSTVPVCAQEFEKCTVAADCCNSPALQCINGRCASPGPK